MVEIRQYSLHIDDTNKSPRKYIIELHIYSGFAMVKYYPFCLKKNAKKYELRGEKIIGFRLSVSSFLELTHECAKLMRDYLIDKPEEFVGYIGQVDSKDNERKRERTQRSAVYDTLTSSIFNDTNRYKIITKKVFNEVNLRLIRMKISRQDGKLTKSQMRNYSSFLKLFEQSPELIYELMTNATKEKIKKQLK